jgi:hypothetical protein
MKLSERVERVEIKRARVEGKSGGKGGRRTGRSAASDGIGRAA